MTLQEFIASNDRNGFAQRCLEKMQDAINLMGLALNNGSTDEFREHLRRVDSCYYSLYGFIQAAYAFGHITLEDSNLLADELMELSKFKV